jgi:hypothetical protein
MKPAVDMLRILYLLNVYQPISRQELQRLFVNATRTEMVFNGAMRRLQEEKFINSTDPLTCRPRGLAALQSLKLYKIRDASRLFSLKRMAKSASLHVDGRQGET